MAKITKSSLTQLAQEMHVLAEQEQKERIGGTNSTYFQFGNSFKEVRVEVLASVQNLLSTQIGETESSYASTMLFDAEDSKRQHDIFATAFIEELDSAVSTSGGIGVTDIDADVDGSGSGGIGSGGIGSGGIGSGGVGEAPKPPKKKIGSHPYPGVHMDKSITQNSQLSHQMAELFESTEFTGILSPFVHGHQNVTFRVGDTGGATMTTTPQANGSIIITINKEYVGEKGFGASSNKFDNVGYKHSGVDSVFSVGLAHEAIHAKHYHIRDEAVRYSGGDLSKAAEFVRSRYNPKLADVMFVCERGVWQHNPNYIRDEHKYIEKYNKEVFNTVLRQYKQ